MSEDRATYRTEQRMPTEAPAKPKTPWIIYGVDSIICLGCEAEQFVPVLTNRAELAVIVDKFVNFHQYCDDYVRCGTKKWSEVHE